MRDILVQFLSLSFFPFFFTLFFLASSLFTLDRQSLPLVIVLNARIALYQIVSITLLFSVIPVVLLWNF